MKRNILYILLSILCSTFTHTLSAQSVPGLLGKRLSLSYDFNPFFNLGSFYASSNYDDSYFNSLIAYKHIVGADYALSRSISIGADYGTANHLLEDYEDDFSNDFQHSINTREYGIRLKYFSADKAGSIAPIGPYIQVRVMGFWYKSEMTLLDERTSELIPSISFIYDEQTILAGSFGFGHQSILFGNIIYNIGCEMAAVLAPRDYEDYDDFILGDTVREYLIYANMFKIKMGLAIPIF